MVRQKAILDLALQFDNACTAKDDLRKAYNKCNNIPQKSSALIDDFLKEGSDKDYDLNLSMYENTAKIEKQMNAKLAWLVENTTTAHKPIYVAKMLKENVFILDSDEALMSTQEYMKKVVEDVGGDDILRVVRGQVLFTNNIDDLNVTMKDLSGIILGIIHHKVIGDGGYEKDINVGAAMILVNGSLFTSKPSKHYLNITMRNVVKVFHKDTVSRSDSG
uniref:Homologous recombination OB-fold protein OB-fold domain-containing protein n=1 Tax=Tanacetum cinerariifolium TaxID=118510 RepID=A0A699IHZ7_TANCI|nr:hypothetical protein [Tanacetum cinerariifolium]